MAYEPRPVILTIICDAESHAPKVVNVDRIATFQDAGYDYFESPGLSGEALLDDAPHPGPFYPLWPVGPYEEAGRERWRRTLKCNLCGLSLDLREENVRRLIDGLEIEGKVVRRTIPLAALVKVLSN